MYAVNRSQKARPVPVPAPVGGLNTLANAAAMPPTDASVMTNMFPYADRVATRPGYTVLSTESMSNTSSSLTWWGFRALMMHASLGVEQVFGAYFWAELNGGSYRARLRFDKVATDGTLTNSRELVATGGTNSLETMGEWTQFTSGAGVTYLLIIASVNIGGTSTFVANAYDGATWTAPAITGVPPGTMGVHGHRNRVWFYGTLDSTNAPKGLSAYYLPVGAIAGAAVEFNVGPFATKGGRIVAMRTWTIDGGVGGTDDLAVFLTDRGQAIVYQGTDPASSATWQLVGVFDVGKPASPVAATTSGLRAAAHTDSFAMKYGADLLFYLEDGISSANRVLRPGIQGQDYTLSAKIRSLFTDAAVSYGALAGSNSTTPWKLTYFGARRQLLASVITTLTPTNPAGGAASVLTATGICYAMNAETTAWCKFEGISMWDALVVGTSVYFIDGGLSIFKYGTAASDNGTAITFEARPAYSYLNSPTNKHVPMLQPMLRSTGNFSLTVEADVDYNPGTISTYTSYTVGSEQNLQPWITANKYGKAVAAHLKGQTSAGVVSWYATNYVANDARSFL